MLTVTVAGGCQEVAAAQARVAAFLEQGDCDPRTILRAELLFEEVVLNALRHGGAPDVAVTAAPAEGAVELLFEDHGQAFDPVTAPLPETSTDLATSRIGGRGLLLLRRMARTMEYERTGDGRNRLRLVVA